MHAYHNLNNCINVRLKVACKILNQFIDIFPFVVEILLLKVLWKKKLTI